ncbi:PadR family transcriptional regulator [Leifsonia shinshuensis]|uniref:Helix-turn-helix transcriptional regulator n=1 Tax=Leifsonia shinshuensis TaxID=150026 RepID=A0A7G6YBJ3_9MICO|nr:PadR family transcriptional regulator [Leifsonia shinshuensis]QNE35858.1 helix-turn-helix transcriptional regulator [Leifsonia shinshuensis]
MTIELREPSFLLLTALADGPKHGYALLSEVADLSDGRVALKVGSLYAIIERAEGAGLVEHVRDEVVSGRLRRYFALSASGRERLVEEASRLEENAKRARERLRRRTGPALAGMTQ